MSANSNSANLAAAKKVRKYSLPSIRKDFKQNKILLLMVLPLVLFYIIFHYMPMGGLIMAFQNYKPKLGLWGSPFVGLQNFKDFFSSVYFGRVVGNTLAISLLDLLITFPVTILFALLLNEITSNRFKRTIQTISYMPYFISIVVVAGIIVDFCNSRGAIAQIVSLFTGETKNLLGVPDYWRPIYIISGMWQGIGFGSIIYIAAIAGVDQELYEAAALDGAGRLRQTLYVTLPGISTTIAIMLILKIGGMLSVGYEKTILLYNPQVYETADIISSFVYRKGLLEFNYGYSTAVGMFNSVINFILLITANSISKKVTDYGLF